MIRIKLPLVKVTSEQLVRITKVSDEYSTDVHSQHVRISKFTMSLDRTQNFGHN
jgi:sulfite reductase (ferredoxin)